METKRIIATVLTVLFALLILAGAFMVMKSWTTPPEEEKPSEEADSGNKEETSGTDAALKEFPSVELLTVENKSMGNGLSAEGRLRPYYKTEIVAELPGMAQSGNKPFKIGSKYTKGETMITLDNRDAVLGLQAAREQVRQIVSSMLPDLKIDMPESLPQWEKYLSSFNASSSIREFPKPLSDRENYYVINKGLYVQYRNIKAEEHRLSKYSVTAPFDGVLVSASVDEGSYVRAGVPLGVLMNASVYEMEAAVPVADLKSIRRGASVKVVSDDSGKRWNGKIKRISDLVDANTQTATVYISLTGSGLREGQYLRAELPVSTTEKAVKISRAHLAPNEKVFVVKDSKLALQEVRVLRFEGEDVWVSGLADGTQLPKEPVAGAFEGMDVTVR